MSGLARDLERVRRRALGRSVLALARGAAIGVVLGLVAVPLPAFEFRAEPRPVSPEGTLPPLPSLDDLPIQLVQDDGTAEGALGVAGGGGARQFLWFEQFALPPGSGRFYLTEIWVLFPGGAQMATGAPVELAVYRDADGDPTNGATLLATFDETIQAVDDQTFSVYSLAPPVPVDGDAGGDVLIGVVPRFIVSGVTPPTNPAALDQTASMGRSWVAVWIADPPAPPALPPDALLALVDQIAPASAGNWMIRGFGIRPPLQEIPTLGALGLGALAGALALIALVALRRRRGIATLLAALLCFGLAAEAAAQTTIDDFSTAQAALADPPGGVGSTVAGAGILGANRDLAVELASGAGPVSVEVSAGALVFAVADTTPDSAGSATVTWDGDTDPAILDPVGLGGADLTAGGASALRIDATITTGPASLVIEVYTDGANSSSAGLALPAGGAASYFLPFGAFVSALGAGADFTDVGAIELRLSGVEVSLSIDGILAVPPVLAATKTDLLVDDVDMDGLVDPGDRVRYTVTITNTGGTALSLDLADTVDANTTLVGGSVRSTPVAADDQYRATGNVTLVVDGTPLAGLLANDADADPGDTPTVTAVDGVSLRGGTVTLTDAASGSFDYVPPAGFRGVDSFAYTIEDSTGQSASGKAFVTIAGIVWFVDNSNACPGTGTQADPFCGLSDLNGVAGDVDGPEDTIFVYEGTSTTPGQEYAGGLALESRQRLIGQPAGLSIGGEQIVPPGGSAPVLTHTATVVGLANDVEIASVEILTAGGSGIAGVGAGGTTMVSNVEIYQSPSSDGVNLIGQAGTFTFLDGELATTTAPSGKAVRITGGDAVISFLNTPIARTQGGLVEVTGTTGGSRLFAAGTTLALSAGTLDGVLVQSCAGATQFDTLGAITTLSGRGLVAANAGALNLGTIGSISATGGAALDLSGTTVARVGGPGTIPIAALTSTSSPGAGVNLDGVSVPIQVTGATTVTDAETTGLRVANGGSTSFDFGATTVIDTSVGAGATANGIDLGTGNAGATFTFDSLSVVTDGGFGLRTSNSGTVNIAGAGNSISATGGAALDLMSTAVGGSWTFSSLSSSGSPTHGIHLAAVSGGSILGSGGAITGASGNAFDIVGGSSSFTYAGSISNASGRSVSVVNYGIGTIGLTGPIADTGTGILLDNNDQGGAGTVLFRGGLALNTGANTAFSAANGGVVIVCADAACGGGAPVVNTIGATTALGKTAVDVSNTTIGAQGLTFRSISVNAGALAADTSAIRLSGTGMGAFTVTGVGSTAGSGGTIENLTDVDAVRLDGTGGPVTLRNMILEDIVAAGDGGAALQTRSGVDAIHGQSVGGGLRLDNTTIRRISDNAVNGSLFADGISATTWNGLEIVNSHLEYSNRFATNPNVGDDADEGLVRVNGLTGTVRVESSTFNNGAAALDLFTPSGAGTLDVTIQSSSFTNLYKEFGCPGVVPTVNVGRRAVSVQVEGTHDAVVRVGDPAETNPALGNVFTNGMTASLVVLGQEGGMTPHTGNIDVVISENDFVVTDHLTGPPGCPGGSLLFNHPSGGVSLNPTGGTFEAIVSNNLFDQLLHAAGGLGSLTLGINTGGGDSEFIVTGNEFRLPWDAAVQIRSENAPAGSAAVLFESNTYTAGMVGGPTDDVGFSTPSPFQGMLVQVRNDGALDLTVRNEALPLHDVAFSPTAQTMYVEVQNQAGNSLDLFVRDSTAPYGYGFNRSSGAFNLYRLNPANVTPVQIMTGNGNTGGGGNPSTSPPTVTTSGVITPSDTAPTLPSVTIP